MNDSQNSTGIDPVDKAVEAARTSREAFGQLFDHFYPLIFAYCSRRLLVRAVAEDVTSEVFLKVAAHFSGFPGSSAEDFRRWVFRIATNEINAQLRQSIRRREMLEAAARMGTVNAAVSTPLLSSETPVDSEDVCFVLNELSEREQSIISLRFFAGLKHDQIADVLDIAPGTSRVALTRALEKLRDRLPLSDQTRRSASGTEQRGHQ
jgi:RNA polymerase sigma-70 factor, ECF subfamily